MIPEVQAVVAAAETWAANRTENTFIALLEAVAALQARRDGEVEQAEAEREWGELVSGDRIYAQKTDSWYLVKDVALDDKAREVKVRAEGIKAPIHKGVDDLVMVRRSELGNAADLFQLLWSGPSRRQSQ